jgi:hypothetical protein
MKSIFTIITILIPLLSFAQNPPGCDLLTIDCCTVFNEDSDSLELIVSNGNVAEEGYGYPGFILLDDNGDTIAMETVGYFAIGDGPQSHYLDIMNPFELPFTGTLELYSGFYDSLHCVFPIMIEATTAIEDEFLIEEIIQIYPNPFKESVYIDLSKLSQAKNCYINVLQEDGKLVFSQKIEQEKTFIPISTLGKGSIYFVQLLDGNGEIIATEKLIKY